ncbi:MAG: hypothetical protein KAJ48_11100, partial [Elusimicrobiales bacterium]|nr:hypothetical protein [Elusimicrobiales bacterium]
EELRTAIWLQHLKNDPATGFIEPINALMINNARIAKRYFKNIGSLKEANFADMVLIDYIPPTPLDAGNFYGHLAFGISQSAVDTTIVNGRILMENKKLKLNIDEEKISRKSSELAAALWKRF